MKTKPQEPFILKLSPLLKKKTQNTTQKSQTKQSVPSLQSLLLSLCQALKKMDLPGKHVHNSLSFHNLRQSEYPRTGHLDIPTLQRGKAIHFSTMISCIPQATELILLLLMSPAGNIWPTRCTSIEMSMLHLNVPSPVPLHNLFSHCVVHFLEKKGHKIINNYREQLRSLQAHSLGLSITWFKYRVSLKAIKL